MGVGTQILELLVRTGSWILIVALVARFLAQLARADFHNPLGQTMIKLTNPVLLPLRKVVPSFAGMDLAAVVLIFIIQLIFSLFMVYVIHQVQLEIPQLAVWAVLGVAGIFFEVLRWSMIIVAVGSWVAAGGQNPLLGFLAQMVEPFVAPFRRLNVQVGMMDFTYLVVFLVIIVLKDILLMSLASSLGYVSGARLFVGL